MATVIFLRGCNFRCPYCFNPELVDPNRYQAPISKEEVLRFLAKRKGEIDGVVFTGGEPTINFGLCDFISEIRSLGYRVKLDTNGSRPDLIEDGLNRGLIDYLAVDLKAPLERYNQVCGTMVDTKSITKTIKITIASGIDYEFRTTVVPGLITGEDLMEMTRLIKGAKRWAIQNFVATKTLDSSYQDREPFSDDDMIGFRSLIQGSVSEVIVR